MFAASKLRWLPVPLDPADAYCLPTDKGVIVMRPLDPDEEHWQLAEYIAGKIEVLHASLPAEWAQGIGEDRAKAFGKLTRRDARWLELPPTDRAARPAGPRGAARGEARPGPHPRGRRGPAHSTPGTPRAAQTGTKP